MNKTNIGWCTHSWNPLVGCTNNCDKDSPTRWCYARRMAHRNLMGCPDCATFTPHAHLERLEDPLFRRKKPAVIFWDSMADWWSDGMQQEWRNDCFRVMHNAPQHRHIILTKRPESITEEDQAQLTLNNIWLGVSITDYAHDFWRVWELHRKQRGHCIVSIEPLLGSIFPLSPTDEDLFFHVIEWTIVGAQTGPGAIHPKQKWIKDIRNACLNSHIPLWEKDNLPTDFSQPITPQERIAGWAELARRPQQAPPAIANILAGGTP